MILTSETRCNAACGMFWKSDCSSAAPFFTQRDGTFACPLDGEIDQLAAVKKALPEIVPLALGLYQGDRIPHAGCSISRRKRRRVLFQRDDLVFIAVDEECRHVVLRQHADELDWIEFSQADLDLSGCESVRRSSRGQPRIGPEIEYRIDPGNSGDLIVTTRRRWDYCPKFFFDECLSLDN
jgi:hypothetical protein